MKLPRRQLLAAGAMWGAVPIRIIATFAALAATNLSGTAQNWPIRPVTIVEPFGASSTPDILVRIMAPRLSELLGQPVIVENVSGAGGMIGVSRVARAAPNGYQLVISSAGSHAYNQTLYKNPLYNAATDFAPVTLLAEMPLMLATRKNLPVKNLQEFIAYAKAHQTEMSYGLRGRNGFCQSYRLRAIQQRNRGHRISCALPDPGPVPRFGGGPHRL
jgi:tripartite-type tricarboxylate transporter receptor subunit TctC